MLQCGKNNNKARPRGPRPGDGQFSLDSVETWTAASIPPARLALHLGGEGDSRMIPATWTPACLVLAGRAGGPR